MEKQELIALIKELVKIPSVTESSKETLPIDYIYNRLVKSDYFKKNCAKLKIIDTPREGSAFPLKALVAEVDAINETNRMVLLVSHVDVVSAKCYGEFEPFAFDTDKLSKLIGSCPDKLYGRGTMDMKAGVALNTLLTEDFAKNRDMFDVNLMAIFVCDEENSSAGARGVLPWLAEQKKTRGLDYLCAIDTEPTEAGSSTETGAAIYLGTLGKLMPSFYIHGVGTHVNSAYKGFSSALAISKIVSLAEGAPRLADACNDFCEASWICLDMGTICKNYSVTVPDKAYAYFNSFVTKSTVSETVTKMKYIAAAAMQETAQQFENSCNALQELGYKGIGFTEKQAAIFTLKELKTAAKKHIGENFESIMQNFADSLPAGDMRQRGLKIVDKLAELSGITEPFAVCFFLPPWLPSRTDYTENLHDKAVVEAARKLISLAKEKFGTELKEIDWFAGLCDLSYFGASITKAEAEDFKYNLPGGDKIYSMPLDAMLELGMPVVNLGPSGGNPHTAEEYLNLKYSVDVLPQLVKEFISELSHTVK